MASDIVKTAGFSTHPKVLLPELGKALEEWKQATDKKDKEKKLKVFNEKYSNAIYVHALENHSAVAETVNQSLQGFELEDKLLLEENQPILNSWLGGRDSVTCPSSVIHSVHNI